MSRAYLGLVTAIFVACGSGDPLSPGDSDAPGVDSARVPLTDLGTGTYLGFQGGLYPGGLDDMPASHAQWGAAAARMIQPLDVNGRPDPTGAVVLLSIGMSNTTLVFCAAGGNQCEPWSFTGQAMADPAVSRTALRIVNGAMGGQVAENWDSADEENYRRIQTQVLAPLGLSEAQVQIVWLKVARRDPSSSLPASDADAYLLQQAMGNDVRALKSRYPNLRQVFISSRIYAGFATTTLNPEPYAYESGFAVKWLIESQIRQLSGGGLDARSCDLSLQAAPWLAWGPYRWARDASRPRSDGLFWALQDYQSDGTHPGPSGEEKVARMLLAFFKTSPFTRCWFLSGQPCG
jgi:hypothetical protein